MPAIDYKTVIVLPHISGLPADTVSMDLAFHDATGGHDLHNLHTDVAGFINSVNGGTAANSIAGYLSGVLSRVTNAMRVESYVRPASAGLPYGSPVLVTAHTLGNQTGTPAPLPSQVSMCLSFAADETGIPEESGAFRPRARRRGRVFIGPLNAAAMAAGGTAEQRPLHTFASAAIASADAQLVSNATTDGFRWDVWSVKDWVGREVVTRYVDDAFDTQRRRAIAATTRWVS